MSAVQITAKLPVLLVILLKTLVPVSTNNETNVIQSSKPLYCCQCNSIVDMDCFNLKVNSTNSTHYKNCTDYAAYRGHKPFCRKIVQTIHTRNELEVVIRKCGWKRRKTDDCYTLRNFDHAETVCQCSTDGCNSASQLIVAKGNLLLLTLCVAAVCFK